MMGQVTNTESWKAKEDPRVERSSQLSLAAATVIRQGLLDFHRLLHRYNLPGVADDFSRAESNAPFINLYEA